MCLSCLRAVRAAGAGRACERHAGMSLDSILGVGTAVIGMVHLRALPGSPRWAGAMERVISAALDDARALAEGGVDALLVENHGDVPFTARRVDAATVAAHGGRVAEIRAALPLPLGINVLKSDARSALAVASATGARFIRVNVHVGAVVADQGIIQSDAYDTLRYRRLLGVDIEILADVQAKHVPRWRRCRSSWRPATVTRADWPTGSSSPAWPRASPRRWPISSACAARRPRSRCSWAAAPRPRPWPSCSRSPTRSSSAPRSSATGGSPTQSTSSASVASSRPPAAGAR